MTLIEESAVSFKQRSSHLKWYEKGYLKGLGRWSRGKVLKHKSEPELENELPVVDEPQDEDN